MFLLAQREGAVDARVWLEQLADGRALSSADDKTLSPDERRAALQQEAARLEEALPLLRRVGID
jgi:hypothetical protein